MAAAYAIVSDGRGQISLQMGVDSAGDVGCFILIFSGGLVKQVKPAIDNDPDRIMQMIGKLLHVNDCRQGKGRGGFGHGLHDTNTQSKWHRLPMGARPAKWNFYLNGDYRLE